MREKIQIVTATKNAGKAKEFEKLLANLPFNLRSLKDFPDSVEPAETGMTFIENAVLKARYYAMHTGIWALADDSGLEVEALDGAPGVLSARYAGENASDAEKINKLLMEITESGKESRRARFVCAIAIVDAQGKTIYMAEGVCTGEITDAPRGARGFGYDPVFVPDGFSQTFGELPDDIKQQISHRAHASEKIIQYLRGFYATSG